MRGKGRNQTGGWMYGILPYIEEQAIYDMTNDGNPLITPQQMAGAKKMQESPVAIFNCPTRRPAKLYQYNLPSGWQPSNSDPVTVMACGDYAANAGDGEGGLDWPVRDSSGKITKYQAILPPKGYAQLDNPVLFKFPPEKDQTGINFMGGEISTKDITDGTSKVYMVGEKYVQPEFYDPQDPTPGDEDVQSDPGDNHSAYQGFDWDVNRWATEAWPATQDRPRWEAFQGFGSAHPGIWQVVFCDGSVHTLPFDMDNLIHRRLANRFDGEVVSYVP
jgi:hypothetical protein